MTVVEEKGRGHEGDRQHRGHSHIREKMPHDRPPVFTTRTGGAATGDTEDQ